MQLATKLTKTLLLCTCFTNVAFASNLPDLEINFSALSKLRNDTAELNKQEQQKLEEAAQNIVNSEKNEPEVILQPSIPDTAEVEQAPENSFNFMKLLDSRKDNEKELETTEKVEKSEQNNPDLHIESPEEVQSGIFDLFVIFRSNKDKSNDLTEIPLAEDEMPKIIDAQRKFDDSAEDIQQKQEFLQEKQTFKEPEVTLEEKLPEPEIKPEAKPEVAPALPEAKPETQEKPKKSRVIKAPKSDSSDSNEIKIIQKQNPKVEIEVKKLEEKEPVADVPATTNLPEVKPEEKPVEPVKPEQTILPNVLPEIKTEDKKPSEEEIKLIEVKEKPVEPKVEQPITELPKEEKKSEVTNKVTPPVDELEAKKTIEEVVSETKTDVKETATDSPVIKPNPNANIITYKPGDFTLSADQAAEVVKIAEKYNPSKRIKIIGYATDTASGDDKKSNSRRIALQRVIEVRKIFIQNGIDQMAIVVQAMGEDKNPASTNKDRVEISVE